MLDVGGSCQPRVHGDNQNGDEVDSDIKWVTRLTTNDIDWVMECIVT